MRDTLQKVVTELLFKKPADPMPLIIQLLEEAKGTGEDPIEQEEREELSYLRDEYQNLREKVMSNSSGTKVSVTNRSVDSSSGESEEEDYVQPLPSANTRKPQAPNARKSISAEAFG